MRKLIFFLSLSAFLFADTFRFSQGEIMAHTEVFGDSNINPKSNQIQSSLDMSNGITSLKGIIEIKSISLKSSNEARDKHMYELLNVAFNPKISFTINKIIAIDKQYKIIGVLELNGIDKKVETIASITNEKDVLDLKGDFSIELTQFNMEPPTMFFLKVRDKIDIQYELSYKKDL